ncbi:MAG: 5'-methylthioadenosine phosphorylase [Rhodobacteraceae bacterium]|nr:5'-methylthioadenosine phosphorylase [Paracoccaceae bacterium]
MRKLILAALLLSPNLAQADGYVLGAGRWPCSEVIRVYEGGTQSEIGQLAGWLLGFWSAATFGAETAFIDIVENAGGREVLEISVAECRKAPPETMLFRLSQSIISNTG